MNKNQRIFYITLAILYILLMIWLFIEKDYYSIIRSICILIGSFIIVIIFAKLGGKDEKKNKT